MIKAEQIPDACAQEAYRVWFNQGGTWKNIVAAAINAWPGMIWHPQGQYRKKFGVTHIILPLPQEGE